MIDLEQPFDALSPSDANKLWGAIVERLIEKAREDPSDIEGISVTDTAGQTINVVVEVVNKND